MDSLKCFHKCGSPAKTYNLMGQKIATLMDAKKSAGGAYLYRLDAGDFSKTMRMLLIR